MYGTQKQIQSLTADERSWAERRNLTHLSPEAIREAIEMSDFDLAGTWI